MDLDENETEDDEVLLKFKHDQPYLEYNSNLSHD